MQYLTGQTIYALYMGENVINVLNLDYVKGKGV